MKLLFSSFPSIIYNDKKVTDIFTSFLLKFTQKENWYTFEKYTVKDGETLQSIAKELYNDETLYWTIIILNNIINPYTGFPISSNFIEEFTDRKYEEGKEGIHHFYDLDKNRMCDDVDDSNYRNNPESIPYYVRPMTNLEYEIEENTKRRDIFVVNPDLISIFVERVYEALSDDS